MVGEQPATRIRVDSNADVDTSTGLPDQTETTTTTQITGTWNPDTGEVAEILDQGEKVTEGGFFITTAELVPSDDNEGQVGDRLEFDGKTYEVRQVDWYPEVIPHYEATIVRVS